VQGHVVINTDAQSTLWFDDAGVVSGLLPLLKAAQTSRLWSRKWSWRWCGNKAV